MFIGGLIGNLCFQVLYIIVKNAIYNLFDFSTLYLSFGFLCEYTAYKSLIIQRQIIYTSRAHVLCFHELVHITWYIEAAQVCNTLQLDQKSSYHSF